MSGTATPPPAPVSLGGVDLTGAGWYGEWYFPPRPIFLRSHAYEVLRRELRRYATGEVPGRSFLIAGHRGAGKTALVSRAVDDLQREIIGQALSAPATTNAATGRSVGLQRPFLVKLHGASLVSVAADLPGDVIWLSDPPPAVANHSAEQALQQITVALYRSLAREIADAFALHARQIDFARTGDARRESELPELAGQLTLDLDQAPDIAALRAAWDRLDRLGNGVLWPAPVGQALAKGGLRDRGVREILALATANQAFQVCIGRIEDKRVSSDGAVRQAEVQAQGRIDARDLSNKLLGLAAGILTGAALWSGQNPVGAVAAGVGAGLVSTLALGWSATRSHRAERGRDYSFIADRSIQTLERDLPLVIERIREAGLAPVFVIDELDKVPNAPVVIQTIINRLKSLTTDYGFFCFLTGRDYYEAIEHKVRTEAFPTEHTYFSHRLLVLYRPSELAAFVRQLWKTEPSAHSGADTAAWILTSFVLHHARLNTIDVMRAVSNLCDDTGRLRPTVDRVLSGPEFLVPMAIQLAIEHILRRPDLRLRIQDDPAFAQLAIDALYMISRTWEERATVSTDVDSLRAHLIARRGISGETEEQQRTALQELADDDVLAVLAEHVTALADLLTGFAGIAAAIAGEPEFLPTPPVGTPAVSQIERERVMLLQPLLSGMPVASPGLMMQIRPGHPEYRFLFDRYGVELAQRERTTLGEGAGLAASDDEAEKLAAALKSADSLFATLARHRLTLDQLVTTQILPFSVVEARIASAMAAIRAATESGTPPLPDDVSVLLGFVDTARVWSRSIVVFAALVDLIRQDVHDAVGQDLSSDAILDVLRRTLEDLPGLAASLADTRDAPMLADSRMDGTAMGSVRGMLVLRPTDSRGGVFLGRRTWAQAIASERRRLVRLRGDRSPLRRVQPEEIAARWYPRFVNWFQGLPGLVEPAHAYVETVLTAAERLPNSLLAHDLNRMSSADWSRFAEAMFQHRDLMPSWIVAAGLRALGFGHRVLTAPPLRSDAQIAQDAAEDRPGTLFIRRDDPDSIALEPQNGPRAGDPVFVVTWPLSEEANRLVIWLQDLDAIENVVVEDGQEAVPAA